MNDEQVKKIEALLAKAELDDRSAELLRQFFYSIANQPQFDKIIALLERFPLLFENFCKCFHLKAKFLAKGKSEAEWNYFLDKEKEFLDKAEVEIL